MNIENQFKKEKNDIKNIFYKYSTYKVRILDENHQLMKIPNNDVLIEHYKKYINLVDTILSSMNNDLAGLLIDVYIKHKSKNELHYSTSTYYVKIRKAMQEFMGYIN